MKRRRLVPLPKSIKPVPDELLSSWLSRLAIANHSDVAEVLEYLNLPVVDQRLLDGMLSDHLVHTLSAAAQLSPSLIRGLSLSNLQDHVRPHVAIEASFQFCPKCRARGFELRHWRAAWTIACKSCDSELVSEYPAMTPIRAPDDKLYNRACKGATGLESAIKSKTGLRRVERVVTFAAIIQRSQTPETALFSGNQHARFTCLAAIDRARKAPLLKAAVILASMRHSRKRDVEDFYRNKPHLVRMVRRHGLKASKIQSSAERTHAQSNRSNRPPLSLVVQAANQALTEASKDWSQAKLLKRADKILQSLKRQPVAVNSETKSSESHN